MLAQSKQALGDPGELVLLIAPRSFACTITEPPGEHLGAVLWKASPEATSGHESFRKPGGTWVLYKPRVALQPSVVEAA
jgi:hypothetical protein